MIGTRVDAVDEPRLIPSKHGWWFIGNGTWTLLRPDQVGSDGLIREDADAFLRAHGAYQPRVVSSFALTVLTSTDCNLGCGYCFQNAALNPESPSRPHRITSYHLGPDVIAGVVEFTRERMARAGLDQLQLLLFGGEPLLNPKACFSLLEQTHPIGLTSASMISNGVLLTPALAARLNARGLQAVQITLDGSREDHDSIRVKRSGAPTFDTIVQNIARASESSDLRWQLRINVSHHNYARVGDLFDELEGKIDPSRCAMTLAWVGDAGFGYKNDLRHLEDVARSFASWSIEAIERGFHVIRPSMKTICHTCSIPGGRYGAVINADGTLYSCWQSAGKPDFAVGTIYEGYLGLSDVSGRWVTCGYEYEQTDPEELAAFHDHVDGRVLDHIYETGRL